MPVDARFGGTLTTAYKSLQTKERRERWFLELAGALRRSSYPFRQYPFRIFAPGVQIGTSRIIRSLRVSLVSLLGIPHDFSRARGVFGSFCAALAAFPGCLRVVAGSPVPSARGGRPLPEFPRSARDPRPPGRGVGEAGAPDVQRHIRMLQA